MVINVKLIEKFYERCLTTIVALLFHVTEYVGYELAIAKIVVSLDIVILKRSDIVDDVHYLPYLSRLDSIDRD